jgi:ketosteroid isomerase-like protein
MSAEEDFEIVRASWAANSRGGIRAGLHLISEDIEIVPFGAALQGKVYHGHDGVLEWWDNEIVPNWESFETIAEDFEPVGEKLLVFGHWRARGRTSGVDLKMPATWVVEVRDGKIAHWQTYTDRDEARQAIGLA